MLYVLRFKVQITEFTPSNKWEPEMPGLSADSVIYTGPKSAKLKYYPFDKTEINAAV